MTSEERPASRSFEPTLFQRDEGVEPRFIIVVPWTSERFEFTTEDAIGRGIAEFVARAARTKPDPPETTPTSTSEPEWQQKALHIARALEHTATDIDGWCSSCQTIDKHRETCPWTRLLLLLELAVVEGIGR